jgi:RNA polymerase sigma-70 factor (ECF subfamily)
VNGYGLPSALFTKADASGPSAEFRMVGRNKPSTTNSSYVRLPRWALGVNVGLTRRLSLESGVVLSPLRTTLTTETGNNRIETRKNQYYLGIPLHLQYTFWQGRRLGLYVTGGPMYQFAVASRVRTTAEPLSGGTVQNLEEDNSLLRDALWSVDLSAGVQYRLFKRGALFVQPGVSWYFPRADAPDNFYSAHSTAFELSFGYRLRLF